MIHLAARGVRALWEPRCGHLPALVIDGASVLHAAPWRDDAAIQTDGAIPTVDRRLGGTFVCAPFGRDDVDGGPPHGDSANAPWRLVRASPSCLVARRRIGRGLVSARVALRDDHPVLYQTHVVDLDAPCTFAHHPMLRLSGGGHVATSPLAAVLTHAVPEEPGRDLYLRGQRADGDVLETRDGPRDWRAFPDTPCEEFLTLVARDTAEPRLGWTAVQRFAEEDTILFLRRADRLPVTGLWVSNRGRDHAPWNGRHAGVLGVEDAVCAGADGFAAALAGEGPVADEGVATALAAGRHVIAHAILRLSGCHLVERLAIERESLRIDTGSGPLLAAFDVKHFGTGVVA